MMTFLVVGDFILNATLLDPSRLGKQRVEASQIKRLIKDGLIIQSLKHGHHI